MEYLRKWPKFVQVEDWWQSVVKNIQNCIGYFIILSDSIRSAFAFPVYPFLSVSDKYLYRFVYFYPMEKCFLTIYISFLFLMVLFFMLQDVTKYNQKFTIIWYKSNNGNTKRVVTTLAQAVLIFTYLYLSFHCLHPTHNLIFTLLYLSINDVFTKKIFTRARIKAGP